MEKNELLLRMRCEFHCHTFLSHDGFTSVDELIQECRKKKIDLVTLTEHDAQSFNDDDVAKIERNGIQIIRGCEITDERGAHIIGLFIESYPVCHSATEIVNHILENGGLVYIPHPFKPDTGFCLVYENEPEILEAVLQKATLMELYNGGWDSKRYVDRIKALSAKYKLKLVGGSDSHKAWQVGYFLNNLKSDSKLIDRKALENAEIEILVLQNAKNTRRSFLKNLKFYQKFIKYVPFKAKRKIKEFVYFLNLKRIKETEAEYKEICCL